MRDLGPKVAEAVVATERNAYAEMDETARRVHYMTWLKHLKVTQYATTAGNNKVLKGEESKRLGSYDV